MENTFDYEKLKNSYLVAKTEQEKQKVIDLQRQRIQNLGAEESMKEVKMLTERLHRIKESLLKETSISV